MAFKGGADHRTHVILVVDHQNSCGSPGPRLNERIRVGHRSDGIPRFGSSEF
jgi:hypothetical protein